MEKGIAEFNPATGELTHFREHPSGAPDECGICKNGVKHVYSEPAVDEFAEDIYELEKVSIASTEGYPWAALRGAN